MSKSRNTTHPNELRTRAEQMATWLVAHPLGAELDPTRLMHELQVHHVELEMQNAELRQARTEVDAASDWVLIFAETVALALRSLDICIHTDTMCRCSRFVRRRGSRPGLMASKMFVHRSE